MMNTFYLIPSSITIVRRYIVRKYSVRFPKGAIVMMVGKPYTETRFEQPLKENV